MSDPKIEPAEVELIAEALAAKLAAGLLRMPGLLRAELAMMTAPSWISPRVPLYGSGDPPHMLEAITRAAGIELIITNPVGDPVWRVMLQ